MNYDQSIRDSQKGELMSHRSRNVSVGSGCDFSHTSAETDMYAKMWSFTHDKASILAKIFVLPIISQISTYPGMSSKEGTENEDEL